MQGLTKESVLTDATLADLSGNGCDMTLYGFTEDETIIDADGALMFDGVDDCGVSKDGGRLLTDFSVFLNTTKPTSTQSAQFYKGVSRASSFAQTIIAINRKNYEAASFGTYTNVGANKSADVVMTPTSYNGIAITRGTNTDKESYVYVIARYGSMSVYSSLTLRNITSFDITLSDTEISQVKQILKIQ